MYSFLAGVCIFACQLVYNGAQIPVCTPAQVEQSPAACATFLSLGFCGFSLGTTIGQQAFSTCPITCGFCQVPPPTTIPPPTIPVCTPAQVEESPATCATFLSFGFCGFDRATAIGQQMLNICPITCGFCQVPPPTTATAAPTTQQQTSAAPTTPQQTSAAPTTQQQTSAAPTTQQQTSAAPTTQQQTSAPPTTEHQTSAAPTTQQQTSAAPTTQQQTSAAPTTQQQSTFPNPTTPGVIGFFNVTLAVFSGRPDPQWVVLESNPLFHDVQRRLGHARADGFVLRHENMPARLGYKGFLVQDAVMENLIVGPNTTALQELLLQTMPDSFRQGVLEEIRSGTVLPMGGRISKRFAPAYNPGIWNNNDNTRRNNNCYNYANNKITGTFAQPGRGSGAIYAAINGLQVQAAAVRDGLAVLNPQPLPLQPVPGPPDGPRHLVALFIRPGNFFCQNGADFHWVRLDNNTKWSHKPGQTSATDRDNAGNVIMDPRLANMGNYVFFSFMTTDTNNININ